MYAITGATGQLGRLTIKQLLKSVPAREIIAGVRDPASADDLAAEGVQVRLADYDRPDTLGAAFEGAERLLLISSNLTTGRVRHHQAVIDAAKAAGVKLLAYTSMLHADHSGAKLAKEHLETEIALAASGGSVERVYGVGGCFRFGSKRSPARRRPPHRLRTRNPGKRLERADGCCLRS
jgi:NAD(P)H dehydrogenase (quinone)